MEKREFFEIFRCNSIFTTMMAWSSWPPFFKHLIETRKKSQLIITPIFPKRSWATPTAIVWSCFSNLTCVPRSSTVINVLKWNIFSSHYKYLTSHSFWTFLHYQQEKLFLFSPKNPKQNRFLPHFHHQMASKIKNSKYSKKQISIPHVHKILGPKVVGNQQYIPEPPHEEKKWLIYQSHVLIIISIFGKTRAIAGLLPNINANSERLK